MRRPSANPQISSTCNLGDTLVPAAAKAKTKESKARLKQTAKDMMLLANAAARRLQIAAENAADSYARAMKNALEEIKAAEAKAAAAAKSKADKKV
jgi:hypothetical protein